MQTTLLLLLLAASPPEPWIAQGSGTSARLRGLAAVSPAVAWAGGSGGTVVRTTDGGASWLRITLPDADMLDCRDIHALDDRTAVVLAAGPGEKSRIYRTTDSGRTWSLAFRSRNPKAFFDAIAFWGAPSGLALGDPLDGQFTLLRTDDGGASWNSIPSLSLPPALPGEGSFAASGTCLTVQGSANAWFATGGGENARVFRSTDRGTSWAVASTPVGAGAPSAGIFSLAFRDAEHGVAVGGDYLQPGRTERNVARTRDGGRTWLEASGQPPNGYRSAVTHVPGTPMTWVAVGPSGTDISEDDGATWRPLGRAGFDAVSFVQGAGWAAGAAGQIGLYRPAP
jgi:photosystem II stability/assembly factor-like uncharacterized protein